MTDPKPAFKLRPFKIRNAEELPEEKLLDLFVLPPDPTVDPFEYENLIVKGKMGSGKTMILKANLMLYRYMMVSNILEGNPPILPVFLRLSDFQHINDSAKIYSSIIEKTLQEIVFAYKIFNNAKVLASLHKGVGELARLYNPAPLNTISDHLKKMTSEEYVERVQVNSSVQGGTKNQFIEASGKIEKEEMIEIRKKPTLGISDVERVFREVLEPINGSILLLFDEAGAITSKFFRPAGEETSLFETLMNQLKTAPYIRVKFAVYPNSYSDILTETRYGDFLSLSDDVITEPGYKKFRKKAIEIINRYLQAETGEENAGINYFDISPDGSGDALEQLILGSEGNTRRLMLLLDKAFMLAAGEMDCSKVSMEHVLDALKDQAKGMEELHTPEEQRFLSALSTVCKDRSSFRFEFPYKGPILSKFVSRSEEQNILKIIEAGTGRRGTLYSFDYAYCVFKGIPTHLHKDSEKINPDRSLINGRWISKKARISDQFLDQVERPERLEGKVVKFQNNVGFIESNGKDYHFITDLVLVQDDKSKLKLNSKVKFTPVKLDKRGIAYQIEVLE